MFRFLLFFFFFSLHLICLLHHVKDTTEVTPRPKGEKNQGAMVRVRLRKIRNGCTLQPFAPQQFALLLEYVERRTDYSAERVESHMLLGCMSYHTAERRAKGKREKETTTTTKRTVSSSCALLHFGRLHPPLSIATRRKKGGKNNICCHSIHFIDQSSVVLTLCRYRRRLHGSSMGPLMAPLRHPSGRGSAFSLFSAEWRRLHQAIITEHSVGYYYQCVQLPVLCIYSSRDSWPLYVVQREWEGGETCIIGRKSSRSHRHSKVKK